MRSDTVTKGKQQAPHRSLFNALGMTQEEMDRPLVGIVSSYKPPAIVIGRDVPPVATIIPPATPPPSVLPTYCRPDTLPLNT